MLKSYFLLVIIFIGSAAMAPPADDDQLDNTNTVALMKANYLYQFASNNNWPEVHKKGKFYIGILGNNAVFSLTAERFGAKPVGNQIIEVVNLREFDSKRFMHILYVDKTKKQDMPTIAKELKGENTLIVTNFDGGLAQGGDINFKTIESVIRYELNKTSVEAKKIGTGVKIIQWAIK